jgi:hypothetical protein
MARDHKSFTAGRCPRSLFRIPQFVGVLCASVNATHNGHLGARREQLANTLFFASVFLLHRSDASGSASWWCEASCAAIFFAERYLPSVVQRGGARSPRVSAATREEPVWNPVMPMLRHVRVTMTCYTARGLRLPHCEQPAFTRYVRPCVKHRHAGDLRMVR